MPQAQRSDALLELLTKPIAFHRIFVKIGGGAAAGLLLSQAFYWSKNKAARERDGWFYKSHVEWEEETGLTRREQQTARAHLRERGLLEEQDGSLQGQGRVLWFRVNHDVLLERIQAHIEAEAAAKGAEVVAPNCQTPLHQTAQGVAPNRPTSVHESAQPVAPNRPTSLITSETTTETTSENTHTRGALALAPSANAGVGVSSSKSHFSFEERKAHALVNGLGAGWLNNSRDGRYDEMIADQQARHTPEAIEATLSTPAAKFMPYGAALMHVASVVSRGGVGSEPGPEIERLFEASKIDGATRDRLLARDWTLQAQPKAEAPPRSKAEQSMDAVKQQLARLEEKKRAQTVEAA